MIELAPHHKIGLPLRGPVMVAAGFCGFGDVLPHGLEAAAFGALVTHPITLRPERGAPPPRVSEAGHGAIINTGRQNPGVKKVLQRYPQTWARAGCPIIAHLPAAEPDDVHRTARALGGNSPLAAIELGLPADTHPADVFELVQALRDGGELPLLVKFPFETPLDVAAAVVEAGADALVTGGWTTAAAPPPNNASAPVVGPYFSPALLPLSLRRVQQLRREFGVPVVAVGGIHSLEGGRALLAAGASAIQLDTLLFIDPQQAQAIAGALAADYPI